MAAGKPHEEWYAAGSEPEVTSESSVPAPAISGEPQADAGETCRKPCARCPAPSQKCDYLPGTVAFLGVLEELRALHLSKTADYGDRDGGDALANIRNGAEMVGIEHWKGGLVRAADKMQRLKTYCRTGTLVHEGVEDSLLDLAAYAVLCLVLFRESNP